MQNRPSFSRLSSLISLLGLATLLVGLVVMVVLPAIRYAAWAILALGVFLLAAAFIIDFRRVKEAVTGRRGIFSTGTTVMASIFIGITLLVNAISIGSYQRFDTTGLSQFTLTSQTRDVLGKMTMPVQIIGFFVPGDPYGIAIDIGDYAESLLTEYRNQTTQLSFKKIDPDEHPDQARSYGITQYETVVFESQLGRRTVLPQQIVEQAEHSFTSAIMEVTGVVQKKVYFLTGHGETSIDSDYSQARQGLLDNLFNVATLDLLRTPAIPVDAAALIIAGPQKSPVSAEIDTIQEYLKNGGWVMLLLNPNSPPEFKQLVSAWGLTVEEGFVIDPSSYLSPNKDSPSVPRTRNSFGLSTTYFPGSTALIPVEKGFEGLEQTPLVWTSPDAWLEKQSASAQEAVFNDGTDVKGPLALGVLILTATPETEEQEKTFIDSRLIVIGDSDFASNQHFYNGENGNLFLNLVQFLTTGKELISIERKVLPFRRLVVGPEVVAFIRFSSIGLLPLVVLITGGVIWWRRK